MLLISLNAFANLMCAIFISYSDSMCIDSLQLAIKRSAIVDFKFLMCKCMYAVC